jgi:HEAT repeat protein
MTMNKRTLTYVFIAGFAAAAGASAWRAAHADSTSAPPRGPASVYKGIPADQIEQLTPADRIRSIAVKALQSPSPAAVWQALEHGEKVDCLDCIPAVEKLLYVNDAKTREISAWWLRRRIFGVFGPGEAYERTIQTLQTNADATTRARAANALGEFLSAGGVAPVATALVKDSSPLVRASAASALNRLNSVGPNNELALALSDADPSVRLAVLQAAVHVRGFTDVAAVARLVSDTSVEVRRHAASALGSMRAKDSVAALIALTGPEESDAVVRAEAAHSLGLIGDISARTALTAAQNDPDVRVRDAATIALRTLR